MADTRAEHIAWCKQRALAELDDPGRPLERRVTSAFASINSDLGKHPDTAGHAAIQLGMMLAAGGHLETEAQMREWIDGIR